MTCVTQGLREHQLVLAEVLDFPQHKIHVHTKRLGGGFGGKETRPALLAALAAVPAFHLKRPVRIAMDRDEDMQFSGQRHAFMAKYKVRFLSLSLKSISAFFPLLF